MSSMDRDMVFIIKSPFQDEVTLSAVNQTDYDGWVKGIKKVQDEGSRKRDAIESTKERDGNTIIGRGSNVSDMAPKFGAN